VSTQGDVGGRPTRLVEVGVLGCADARHDGVVLVLDFDGQRRACGVGQVPDDRPRVAGAGTQDSAGRVGDVEDEVDEQLANFGLEEVADIRADKLSHGDRKILDVAIAYALDLEYMFLDEPTAGVVTEKKHDLIETVLAMTREELGATVVIEHDMDLVTEHGDRVIALQEGEVFRDGPPSILKTDDELRRTLLGIEA